MSVFGKKKQFLFHEQLYPFDEKGQKMMDEQNPRGYPGEKNYYSEGKIFPRESRSVSQPLLPIFIGITILLLVVVIVFGAVIVHLLTTSSQTSSRLTVLARSTATTVVVQQTATPLPTPTPTPIPGTVSKVGDVCMPEMSMFPQNASWQTVGNKYVYTGQGDGVVMAPCNLTVPNYSVEMTVSIKDCGYFVLARANTNGTRYASGVACTFLNGPAFAISDGDIVNGDKLASTSGYATYTIKLVVKDADQSLYYNGSSVPIDVAHLTTLNSAGAAGFQCQQQCQVSEFKVTGI